MLIMVNYMTATFTNLDDTGTRRAQSPPVDIHTRPVSDDDAISSLDDFASLPGPPCQASSWIRGDTG